MADHSNEQQPQGSPTMSAIIKLDTSPPYPISDYTPSDIVSGKPKAGVNSQFMSADKKLSAGISFTLTLSSIFLSFLIIRIILILSRHASCSHVP
eukprot:TRINITY_DN3010_c0_g1_i1.p1 TRINITY_DN3010_c0_g1~~TRINITY_DN3010_c0_g1_i1.p1  ORF type:complete len:110 (-),score=22.35 TRINITY_DN3010_c0_g1_i1:282-566(-)